MHKISVPVQTSLVNEKTKYKYLELLKRSNAQRVLLISMEIYGSEAQREKERKALKYAGDFFRENGIEPSIWIGQTIGHGARLAGVDFAEDENKTQQLVTLSGTEIEYTNCPFDENFRKKTGELIASLAETGIKLIFLDDDYRLSQRGDDFCCACPLHMNRIEEILGEKISREELKQKAFFDKAGKYRDAWLQAQRESLELLAKDIRKEVDKVDKSICVALCNAHSIWGVDGSSAIDVARILAGENKPVARLHPAPYWAEHCAMPLSVVFDLARMFGEFSKNSGTELIAEGDTYPRPRYNTPASYLELFDGVIRADGTYDGDLKYMIDYCSDVTFEEGYVEHHENNFSAMEEISRIFENKTASGVYVPVDRHVLEYADLTYGDGYANNYPFPSAAVFMSKLGIPVSFSDNGTPCVLFGETARNFELDRIKDGAILDGISARILQERGVDVGLIDAGDFAYGEAAMVFGRSDKYLMCMARGRGRFLNCRYKNKACTAFTAEVDGKLVPLVYEYVNESGAKFTVFLVDMLGCANNSHLFVGYHFSEYVKNRITDISGKKPVAFMAKNTGVYVMASKKDKKLAVALFNTSADTVLKPEIELDGKYSVIHTVNCDGAVTEKGVKLTTPLHAFDFAAFEVEE